MDNNKIFENTLKIFESAGKRFDNAGKIFESAGNRLNNANKSLENTKKYLENASRISENTSKRLDKLEIIIDKYVADGVVMRKNTTENMDKYVAEGVELRKMMKENIVDSIKHRIFITENMREQTSSIRSMNKTINGYIKNEANIIEDEVNESLIPYFKKDEQFANYNIFELTKEWGYLNIPTIDPEYPTNYFANNKLITEFDGLYVISNDRTFFLSDKYKRIKTMQKETNPVFKKFVVVEAKHSITTKDITRKIEQIQKFQNYLKIDPGLPGLTDDFKRKQDYYKLNEFSDEIILIFGSEHFAKTDIDYIKKMYKEWIKLNIYVSYIQLSGDRYELHNYDVNSSGFKANNLIYADKVITSGLNITRAGGKRKKTQ
jgi:hypothetical protein